MTTTQQRLIVEECTNPSAWDEFVERNDGSPYTLWGWSDAVAIYGHDRWHLVATDGDRILGALPLFHLDSRLFDSALVSVPFASRGSLILDGERSDTVAAALLNRTKQLADERSVDYVSLRGIDIGSHEAFASRRRFVTFRTPLTSSTDEVWDRLKDSRQRQIRQARDDESLTYDVGNSMDDLHEFYQLYLTSMRGHGTPPHSFEFFRTLWGGVDDHGELHLAMVRHNGSLINAVLNFGLGSTMFQKSVVVDPEHRELNGGSLLQWKSFEWAIDHGYQTYDFGRTREGTGVYMFKKSFGGEKTWLEDYHYFPNGEVSLPDPDDDSYDWAKAIWRQLPLPVTQQMGPRIRRMISL